MSIIAQMDGLPASADSNAVVLALRNILQKLKIRFWVSEFSYSVQTKTNKCKIKFFSKEDSIKAINKITSKPQNIIGITCDVKITVVSENAKEIKEGNAKRARSRSPISKEKANINKELERLKKEKEELEKRKSELLKKKMDIDQKDTKTDDKDVTFTKIHPSIMLPKCPAAEIAIIDEMKPLAKPYVQKRFYQNLMQRLHVEIRTKLAILLESGGKLRRTSPVEQIVKAYRDKYPKENDSQVLENIVRQVKMAFWAYKAKKTEGTNNSEPYEYDESEEEDTNDDNQGVTTVVKSNTGDDNKMEITEDDVTSKTKDTMTPTTEGGDEAEGGNEEESIDDAEGEYLEGEEELEGVDEAEYGDEAEGDNEAEVGNEEDNKVSS